MAFEALNSTFDNKNIKIILEDNRDYPNKSSDRYSVYVNDSKHSFMTDIDGKSYDKMVSFFKKELNGLLSVDSNKTNYSNLHRNGYSFKLEKIKPVPKIKTLTVYDTQLTSGLHDNQHLFTVDNIYDMTIRVKKQDGSHADFKRKNFNFKTSPVMGPKIVKIWFDSEETHERLIIKGIADIDLTDKENPYKGLDLLQEATIVDLDDK